MCTGGSGGAGGSGIVGHGFTGCGGGAGTNVISSKKMKIDEVSELFKEKYKMHNEIIAEKLTCAVTQLCIEKMLSLEMSLKILYMIYTKDTLMT